MKLVGGLGVEGAVTQLASDVIHHSIPSVHEASVEATEKGRDSVPRMSSDSGMDPIRTPVAREFSDGWLYGNGRATCVA